MFTGGNGKLKEQNWKQAGYDVRCEGTTDFNEWFVLVVAGHSHKNSENSLFAPLSLFTEPLQLNLS